MSRARVLVIVSLIVVFVVAGGILLYSQQHRGGQNLTFNVTVKGGTTMTPSDLAAHLNDNITLNVTSDLEGEVHLHDYDIHFDTRPGQTVTHAFKADRTCSCDIEWESTSHPLGTLTVSP